MKRTDRSPLAPAIVVRSSGNLISLMFDMQPAEAGTIWVAQASPLRECGEHARALPREPESESLSDDGISAFDACTHNARREDFALQNGRFDLTWGRKQGLNQAAPCKFIRRGAAGGIENNIQFKGTIEESRNEPQSRVPGVGRSPTVKGRSLGAHEAHHCRRTGRGTHD